MRRPRVMQKKASSSRAFRLSIGIIFFLFYFPLWVSAQDRISRACSVEGEGDSARLGDEQIPLMLDLPKRTGPIIEWGDKHLGQGPIKPGILLPSGSVLQPSLWVFGAMRSAFQVVDDGAGKHSQWVNRLNLFGNIKINGTDRIVAGLRPLDQAGVFSGRQFDNAGSGENRWLDGSNLELRTLYYEGDLSELFPNAGRGGNQPKNLGLVLGRQPLGVQAGILINDTVDAIGLSRLNIPLPQTSDFRISGLFGWNEIHRANHMEDRDAWMLAMFSQADFYRRTIAFDAVYVDSSSPWGSGYYFAASQFRPIGRYNSTIRVAISQAVDQESDAVSDGYLVLNELSWSPFGREDIIYFNSFLGIDRFTSAARGPATGGPLGRTGLLFASPGMGNYGAPLGNFAENSAGGALGYQYFPKTGQQFVFEVGLRGKTEDTAQMQWGGLVRFQQALTRRLFIQLDGFLADGDQMESKWGSRVELFMKL